MLVVISDLHLEEEASRAIPATADAPPVVHRRNLPARAYRRFFATLAAETIRNGARRIDLVLAGDVFDVHRTSLWMRDNPNHLRPYVSRNEMTEDLEEKVLKILNAIASEPEVSEILHAFQLFVQGRYFEDPVVPDVEREYPVPTRIHLITGNHDRITTATPTLRRRLRSLLGLLEEDRPFSNFLSFPREQAWVRHGHEYDKFNFSADHTKERRIPPDIAQEEYDAPALGDFVTVDLVSRLPAEFREVHGDEEIASSTHLRKVYERLLEFDDLRPQSALLSFLLSIHEGKTSAESVWRCVEPAMVKLLNEIQDHPYLHGWLERLDRKWHLDAIDAVQAFLAFGSWKDGISISSVRALAGKLRRRTDGPVTEELASRESVVLDGRVRFLVAGHTHRPCVSLLKSDRKGERYYVDTGTWRNRILSTPNRDGFGRLRTLSYVVIYDPEEDRGESGRPKVASMDYWTGFTRRWSR